LTRRIRSVYSEDERQDLAKAVAKLRQANREMVEDLGLVTSEFTEQQIVNARVSHLWTILVDSKSKKLKNFGEVPREHTVEIDRHIDKLLEILKLMM